MIETFLFGIYPYIALTVFAVGSWVRFDREQYGWKADSTQLLSNKGMRVASNFFHIGVIAVLGGHFVGLLTPHSWFLAMGVSDMTHQWVAILAGSVFGGLCLIGAVMLWVRRLTNARVKAAGRASDTFVITWILVTLLLGLSTIPTSIGHAGHGDAGVMIALAEWIQSVVRLQADPALLAGVDPIFKIHMAFGLTLFLVFPFTRLVHIWSVPIGYLGRAYQVVRAKGRTV
jgi:nitrate reductase gamma subunit